MSDTEKVFGWIGFAFNVIVANLIAHGLWSVHSKKRLIQWSARHFEQLYYALFWSILFVLIERNLQLLGGILGLINFSLPVRWCLNNVFGIGYLALFLLRAWIVHFDFHSGVALANLVSNPDLKPHQKEHLQWFLDNKRNYGSPKYLTRFTLAMVVILNLFMLGWSLISPSTFVYAMIMIYAVLIVVAIGITRHITLLDDNFFIRQEILMEFRLFAVMFIVGGVIIIFGPPMGWQWGGFLLTELSVVVILAMCFVSTYWVMRKTYSVGLDSVAGTPNIQLPSNAPPLSMALKDKKATTELIRHLVNEVSVENIFFLSDVMAYKYSFVRNSKLPSLGKGFRCDVSMSLSRLIYRRTFTHYAWAISKTYIDGASSLYVTAISEDVREEITDKLEEKDPSAENQEDTKRLVVELEQLQDIFDPAAAQVYEELRKAYARFAYTAQFQRIANLQQRRPQSQTRGQTPQ
eukprot:CAMPEP_0197022166 /NCGR_PEP_ID=MMETSP1384-20130603/3063_1 /TAXON_ID=29189 /ORGANISM="Ammonia sp." /LENGTH=462 /DNA_ID=CAMNT_0042450145 /DNA_START=20 /DNA_END=1408 /DNA_ORIENTATION=+